MPSVRLITTRVLHSLDSQRELQPMLLYASVSWHDGATLAKGISEYLSEDAMMRVEMR
jgi:hypothetical protein